MQKQVSNKISPAIDVTYVSNGSLNVLSSKSVTVGLVGEKAYGLACIPPLWTLPFIVVASDLWEEYVSNSYGFDDYYDNIYSTPISQGIKKIHINEDDFIIVRSSSDYEGINERGEYYSKEGVAYDIKNVIHECLKKMFMDYKDKSEAICLIIQKLHSPITVRGHLSNERRVSQEDRDWLAEVDKKTVVINNAFPVSLRNWRHKIDVKCCFDSALDCNLTANLQKVLKIPATWAYDNKVRMHFEWVWDSKKIILVQADFEKESDGKNPTKLYLPRSLKQEFKPQLLRLVDDKYQRYKKVHNSILYESLGLNVVQLYVLDDKKVIQDLSLGVVPEALREDLNYLVRASLVIRVDLNTDDKSLRQLLPRTSEVRDAKKALSWLINSIKDLKQKNALDYGAIFIFHNFIPAISSAFAYSSPGERKVQIESLWGIPEGLYYNSHDKHIVDTKDQRISLLSQDTLNKYSCFSRENYKKYFVRPNKEGEWKTEVVKPPYDWSLSINKTTWLQKIAYESRRIAESEKKPLSIMWFVGIPKDICPEQVMPWYHEEYDLRVVSSHKTERRKTPFDQTYTIYSNNDIERLGRMIDDGEKSVKRIRIQPQDESLLRDKDTIAHIAHLSNKSDAVIMLEGGILSHAYYQLIKNNAIVEVMYPFPDKDDESEFNKLVRDKIKDNILDKGESVDYTRLDGEHLLQAMKNKLIEESFEVLDAKEQDSIIDEIADVSEVVEAILCQLGVQKSEVEERRAIKKEKSGGFDEGLILLKTKNKIPINNEVKPERSLFGDEVEKEVDFAQMLSPVEVFEKNQKIDKWTDKRIYKNALQGILKLSVPVYRDGWIVKTAEVTLDDKPSSSVIAEIECKREGARAKIKLSIFLSGKISSPIEEIQLDLFESKQE